MNQPLNVLLADDDADDRFFFEKAIKFASIPASLNTVDNGERLMQYLASLGDGLPDVLFLDLNMPRKNGSECLREIKGRKSLESIPVIIYSTSLHSEIADLLYAGGAHYYIKKTNISELQKVLNYTFGLLSRNELTRPERDRFILSSNTTALVNNAG